LAGEAWVALPMNCESRAFALRQGIWLGHGRPSIRCLSIANMHRVLSQVIHIGKHRWSEGGEAILGMMAERPHSIVLKAYWVVFWYAVIVAKSSTHYPAKRWGCLAVRRQSREWQDGFVRESPHHIWCSNQAIDMRWTEDRTVQGGATYGGEQKAEAYIAYAAHIDEIMRRLVDRDVLAKDELDEELNRLYSGIKEGAAGRHTLFMVTATRWIAQTDALEIASKRGYSDTAAHPNIAGDFCMWQLPGFRLEMIVYSRNACSKDEIQPFPAGRHMAIVWAFCSNFVISSVQRAALSSRRFRQT